MSLLEAYVLSCMTYISGTHLAQVVLFNT